MRKSMKVNLFIIGVPRCGTTWLHRSLDLHPLISMSKPKELYYWDMSMNYPLEKYHSHFKFNAPYIGESTPTYFRNMATIDAILNYNKNAKFILILRDPVDRLESAISYAKQMDRGLTERMIKDSNYHEFVPALQERLGKKLLILRLEDGNLNNSFDVMRFLNIHQIQLIDRKINKRKSVILSFLYKNTVWKIRRTMLYEKALLIKSKINKILDWFVH